MSNTPSELQMPEKRKRETSDLPSSGSIVSSKLRMSAGSGKMVLMFVGKSSSVISYPITNATAVERVSERGSGRGEHATVAKVRHDPESEMWD